MYWQDSSVPARFRRLLLNRKCWTYCFRSCSAPHRIDAPRLVEAGLRAFAALKWNCRSTAIVDV